VTLQGEYLLEVCRPFELRVHHCQIRGELTPLGNPTLTLTPLRALSLLTVRSPPVAMALVPPRVRATTTTMGEAAAAEEGTDGYGAPAQCLVLRAGGELCLLDLIAGGERSLATGVDLFWLTMPAPGVVPVGGSLAVPGTPRRGDGNGGGGEGGEGGEKATTTEELPWWVYSHRGMQVTREHRTIPLGDLLGILSARSKAEPNGSRQRDTPHGVGSISSTCVLHTLHTVCRVQVWYPASPAAATSRHATQHDAPPTLVSATTENHPELALDREVRQTDMDVP
jgi:hypothetical protein